jgi:nitroreductase
MDLNTVDHLLSTTRTVRKRLDFDRPVEPSVIQECLDLAIQAPSGSNSQGWRFVVITDAEKRATVAGYYRDQFRKYIRSRTEGPELESDDPRAQRASKVASSAVYLSANMHKVPVLIIPCVEGRVENTGSTMAQASLYGSILPATWSLMLALRSRGLGAAWTTLHLAYEAEVAELLGIPETMTQAALLPVAYYTGDDFKPGKRVPARELTYWDGWGETR